MLLFVLLQMISRHSFIKGGANTAVLAARPPLGNEDSGEAACNPQLHCSSPVHLTARCSSSRLVVPSAEKASRTESGSVGLPDIRYELFVRAVATWGPGNSFGASRGGHVPA